MGKVEDFLKMYKSKGTIRTYRWSLSEFFTVVYGEDEGKAEQHADRYFTEERNVQEDIQAFFITLKDKPPKTIHLMLSAVRSFFIENGVELPQRFWRRLRKRVKGSRALTLDKVPSNLELKKVIMHLPVRGKALYLVLASSGMRIGETLQLKLEDIEFDKEPCRVNIRGEYTKTGNSRVAFVSKEASMVVGEWLKVRGRYLEAASKKSHKFGKAVEDPRLFPFEAPTAYSMWNKALEKSGYAKRDTATNYHAMHPHVLRKFFRTRLGAVISVDVVEALMGHEEYLTEVYRKYSMEDLAKFYLQGEAALLVFTEAEEVGRLRVEVEESKQQLQNIVNTLLTENTDLKHRIRLTEQKLGELERLVRKTLETAT